MSITCSMAGFWFDLKVTVFLFDSKPSIHPSPHSPISLLPMNPPN